MSQRIPSLPIDQNNKKELDFLYNEMLVRELIMKTELFGVNWSLVAPGEYYAYERDLTICTDPYRPQVLWEYRLSQTVMNNDNVYNLQIYRNSVPYLAMNTSATWLNVNAVDELYDIAERMTLNPGRHSRTALRAIQNITDVRDFLLGPPFTLRPNDDLGANIITAPGTGWKRVPAMGHKWEKIRTPVDANDGDGSYIYDDTNTTQEFAFDVLPDGTPQSYSSVTLRICVKNTSAPALIGASLVVEAPGFTPRSQSFSSATTGSYSVVEWTWTPVTAFDRLEINFMRVRFESATGINRITSVELVANA
jgi:hypothetical protein